MDTIRFRRARGLISALASPISQGEHSETKSRMIALVMLVALVGSQKAVSQAVHAPLSQQKQCEEQAKHFFKRSGSRRA